MKKILSFYDLLATYQGKSFSLIKLMNWVVLFGGKTSIANCYVSGEDISRRLNDVPIKDQLGLKQHIGASLSVLAQLKEVYFNGADAAAKKEGGSVRVVSNSDGSLSIVDTGEGMSLQVLLETLFIPTESTKRSEKSHSIGCMGVGALGCIALLTEPGDKLTIQTCSRTEKGELIAYELVVTHNLMVTLVQLEAPTETGTSFTFQINGLQSEAVASRFQSDFRFISPNTLSTGFERKCQILLSRDSFSLKAFFGDENLKSGVSFTGITKGLFTIGPLQFESDNAIDISLDLKVPTAELAVTESRDRFVLNVALFNVMSELIESLPRLLENHGAILVLHVIRAVDELIYSFYEEGKTCPYYSELSRDLVQMVTQIVQSLQQSDSDFFIFPDSLSGVFLTCFFLPDHLLDTILWHPHTGYKRVETIVSRDMSIVSIRTDDYNALYHYLDDGVTERRSTTRQVTLYLDERFCQSLLLRPDECSLFLTMLKEQYPEHIKSPFHLIDKNNSLNHSEVLWHDVSAYRKANHIPPGLTFINSFHVDASSDMWRDRYNRLSIKTFGIACSETSYQVYHFYEGGVFKDTCTFSTQSGEVELSVDDILYGVTVGDYSCLLSGECLYKIGPNKEVTCISVAEFKSSTLSEFITFFGQFANALYKSSTSLDIHFFDGAILFSFFKDGQINRFLVFESDGLVRELTGTFFPKDKFETPFNQSSFFCGNQFVFWAPKEGACSMRVTPLPIRLSSAFASYKQLFVMQQYTNNFIRDGTLLYINSTSAALTPYEGNYSFSGKLGFVFPMKVVLSGTDSVELNEPFEMTVLTSISGLEGKRKARFETVVRKNVEIAIIRIENRVFIRDPFHEVPEVYLERDIDLSFQLMRRQHLTSFGVRALSGTRLNTFMTYSDREGKLVLFFDDGTCVPTGFLSRRSSCYQRPDGDVVIYPHPVGMVQQRARKESGIYAVSASSPSPRKLYTVYLSSARNSYTVEESPWKYKMADGYLKQTLLCDYDDSSDKEGIGGKLPMAYNHLIRSGGINYFLQASSQCLLEESGASALVKANMDYLNSFELEEHEFASLMPYLTLNPQAFSMFVPTGAPMAFVGLLGAVPVQYFARLEQVLLSDKAKEEGYLGCLFKLYKAWSYMRFVGVDPAEQLTLLANQPKSKLESLQADIHKKIPQAGEPRPLYRLFCMDDYFSEGSLTLSTRLPSYMDFVRQLSPENFWVVSQLFSSVSIPSVSPISSPELDVPSVQYPLAYLLHLGQALPTLFEGECDSDDSLFNASSIQAQLTHQMTRVVGPGESKYLPALWRLNSRLLSRPLAVCIRSNEVLARTEVVFESLGNTPEWSDVIDLFFNLESPATKHLLSFLHEQGELTLSFVQGERKYVFRFFRDTIASSKSCDFDVEIKYLPVSHALEKMSLSFTVPFESDSNSATVYDALFVQIDYLASYQSTHTIVATLNDLDIPGKASVFLSNSAGFDVLKTPHSMFLSGLDHVREIEIEDLLPYAPYEIVVALLNRGISIVLPVSVELRKDGRDFKRASALDDYSGYIRQAVANAYLGENSLREIAVRRPHPDFFLSQNNIQLALEAVSRNMSTCSVESYFVWAMSVSCVFNFSTYPEFSQLGQANLVQFFTFLCNLNPDASIQGVQLDLMKAFPSLTPYFSYSFSRFQSHQFEAMFKNFTPYTPPGEVLFESSISLGSRSCFVSVFLLKYVKALIAALGGSEDIQVGWGIIPLNSVGRNYTAYADVTRQHLVLNPVHNSVAFLQLYTQFDLLINAINAGSVEVEVLYKKVKDSLLSITHTTVHELSHLQGNDSHDLSFYAQQSDIFSEWLLDDDPSVLNVLRVACVNFTVDYPDIAAIKATESTSLPVDLHPSMTFWAEAITGDIFDFEPAASLDDGLESMEIG